MLANNNKQTIWSNVRVYCPKLRSYATCAIPIHWELSDWLTETAFIDRTLFQQTQCKLWGAFDVVKDVQVFNRVTLLCQSSHKNSRQNQFPSTRFVCPSLRIAKSLEGDFNFPTQTKVLWTLHLPTSENSTNWFMSSNFRTSKKYTSSPTLSSCMIQE